MSEGKVMDEILSSKLHKWDGIYLHWCPGCKQEHWIFVDEPSGTGATWSYNGNPEKPTFSPSVNIVGQCHYFITDGEIQFCGDSKHELAGQTIPLPNMPH